MTRSVVDRVFEFARSQPEASALVIDGREVSYGEFARDIVTAADALHRNGVLAGDTIALVLDGGPPVAYRIATLYFGINYLGAAIVPLPTDLVPVRRREWLDAFKARAVDASILDAPPLSAGLAPPRGDDPGRTAQVRFTSGTTGARKAVVLTNAMFLENIETTSAAYGLSPSDRVLPTSPLPEMLGLRHMLRALVPGGTLVNEPMPPDAATLEALVLRQGITVVASVPAQARSFLASAASLARRPLPLRVLLVGGAAIRPKEIEALRAELTPNVYCGYGATDFAHIAMLRPGDPVDAGLRIAPGVEVQAVDADHRSLGPGGRGELRMRAPWAPAAYVGEPAPTERFRDGWFYSGDIGKVTAEGRLFLEGRSDEMINRSGWKILPEEVESAVASHTGVVDVAVIGIPDPSAGEVPVACVVLRRETTAEELLAHCRDRLPYGHTPVGFVGRTSIPRNADGKIDRRRLREEVSSRRASASAANPQAVRSVVAAVLDHATSRPESSAMVDDGREVTYAELARALHADAARLAAAGVRGGDTIALAIGIGFDPVRVASVFYGLIYLGAAVLPLPLSAPVDWRERVTRLLGARVIDPADLPEATGASEPPRGDDPGLPAQFRFTSGTTGAQKIVRVTNAQLAANARNAAHAFDLNDSDRLLPSLRFPALVAFRHLLRAHAVGAALVNINLPGRMDELRTAVAQSCATQLCATPAQLRLWLATSQGESRPIDQLRAVQTGGAPMLETEFDALRRLLSPRIYRDYGANDFAVIAVGHPDDPPASGLRLLPDVEAAAVDESGIVLAPGRPGLLRFRSPNAPDAYVSGEGLERFREGWFHPGDLGAVTADRRVILLGRADDMINRGGVKIDPVPLETLLAAHPLVADAAVVGVPDPVSGEVPVAFVVLRGQVTAEDLFAWLRDRVESRHLPVGFSGATSIPRNEEGKVLRAKLREAAAGSKPPTG